MFDGTNQNPNAFTDALYELRLGYVENFLPTLPSITGPYSDKYFDVLRSNVGDSLSIARDMGFCTLVFDGWEHDTSFSVLNVLLHMKSLNIAF